MPEEILPPLDVPTPDVEVDPERVLALLRRSALTQKDCYGCVDWFHFDPEESPSAETSPLSRASIRLPEVH